MVDGDVLKMRKPGALVIKEIDISSCAGRNNKIFIKKLLIVSILGINQISNRTNAFT